MSLIAGTGAPPPRRRRGSELENALLDAAWAEFTDRGYDRFTIEAVAERAQTSRAVLYRRWPGKAELILAAAARAGVRESTTAPDTGSLRGDMLALLRELNSARATVGVGLILQLGGYHAATGAGIAELRDAYLSGHGNAVDEVIARAARRGEVDTGRLTPRVVAVPFDLCRQELLMTLTPLTDDVIESILDEVFLPLVCPR